MLYDFNFLTCPFYVHAICCKCPWLSISTLQFPNLDHPDLIGAFCLFKCLSSEYKVQRKMFSTLTFGKFTGHLLTYFNISSLLSVLQPAGYSLHHSSPITSDALIIFRKCFIKSPFGNLDKLHLLHYPECSWSLVKLDL